MTELLEDMEFDGLLRNAYEAYCEVKIEHGYYKRLLDWSDLNDTDREAFKAFAEAVLEGDTE